MAARTGYRSACQRSFGSAFAPRRSISIQWSCRSNLEFRATLQRSSRWATGTPERERPYRRFGALRLPGPGSVRRRPYSRLWVPSRVVEGFGLSPEVRVWVVSARGSLPRWAAGAPARCREPARRAWVLLLTALRWCWRRSAWSPGRSARGPARRRRAEASWGPGLPGITAAGAAGHRGHALVFGTAACVASAAPGG
jgi:hypothetical protein